MPTSLNHQPEVHHPKSPAIRWAADYPIYASDRYRIAALRQVTFRADTVAKVLLHR
jgi:hypothetical protein